jgi:hypothetical protein
MNLAISSEALLAFMGVVGAIIIFNSIREVIRRRKTRIYCAVVKGANNTITFDVTSKEPSEDDQRKVDLDNMRSDNTRALAKSIEELNDYELLITFWNGNTMRCFEPVYIIRKEVSHE